MTRNFKLFAGAAFIFYFIGVVNDAAAVYVLSGMALAVIAGCFWLSRLAVAGLDLELALPRREVTAGHSAPAHVKLANTGIISRPGPLVNFTARNTTIAGVKQEYTVRMPPLARGEHAEGVTEITLPSRGHWQIGPPRLVGTDPLGMFYRPGPFADAHSIIALPRVFDIPTSWQSAVLAPAARQIAQSRQRQGGEFWGIRQHEPGDDLRHVHWKVTARTGDLAVKEYVRGRELATCIWLDTAAANIVGSGEDSSMEMGVSLAASLVPALLRIEQAVALVGHGLPSILQSPDRGEAVASRALRALAEVQPVQGVSFAGLVNAEAGHVKPGLTAIIVTSGIETGLLRSLIHAGTRGAAVRCLVVAPDGELDPQQREAQAALVAGLRSRGIAVGVARSFAELPFAVRRLSTPGGGMVA